MESWGSPDGLYGGRCEIDQTNILSTTPPTLLLIYKPNNPSFISQLGFLISENNKLQLSFYKSKQYQKHKKTPKTKTKTKKKHKQKHPLSLSLSLSLFPIPPFVLNYFH